MQNYLLWSWKASGVMLFFLISHIFRKARAGCSKRNYHRHALWCMAAEYLCYIACAGILFG